MEKIDIQMFDKLDPDGERTVAKLDAEAFQENYLTQTLEQKLEQNDKFTSKQDIFNYILAFQKNEIVGGITLSKRTIHFEGQSFLLGGIGSVWTRKDKRRMGISTMLLTEGMKMLFQTNCAIAYLCTDIDKLGKLYGKFGFVPLGKRYTFLGKSGKRYYETDGMIAPIKSPQLFDQIRNSDNPFDIGHGNW